MYIKGWGQHMSTVSKDEVNAAAVDLLPHAQHAEAPGALSMARVVLVLYLPLCLQLSSMYIECFCITGNSSDYSGLLHVLEHLNIMDAVETGPIGMQLLVAVFAVHIKG